MGSTVIKKFSRNFFLPKNIAGNQGRTALKPSKQIANVAYSMLFCFECMKEIQLQRKKLYCITDDTRVHPSAEYQAKY